MGRGYALCGLQVETLPKPNVQKSIRDITTESNA